MRAFMLVLALLSTAQAFGPISRLTFGPSLVTNQLAVRSFPSRRIACAPSMNQDEIAELEAKLAALKAAENEKAAADAALASAEEVAARAAEAPPSRPSGTSPADLDPEGFDVSTLSARKKVAVIKERPPEELLSEAWKEADDSDGSGGGGLAPVVGGVIFAILLVVLAQVPTDGSAGQVAPPPLPTASQIRAQYEEVGALEE
jgi:hypothetical protein